jgi:hypothetical protein
MPPAVVRPPAGPDANFPWRKISLAGHCRSVRPSALCSAVPRWHDGTGARRGLQSAANYLEYLLQTRGKRHTVTF